MTSFVSHSCLVYGEPSSGAFAVKREFVSVLKRLIKDGKKPALGHLPADTLDLWQVSVPEENDEGLENFVLEDSKN